jgi:hypothetical protein
MSGPSRLNRAIRVTLLAVLLLVAWWALNVGMAGLAERQMCHEDMACWDCTTMGNLSCGP